MVSKNKKGLKANFKHLKPGLNNKIIDKDIVSTTVNVLGITSY